MACACACYFHYQEVDDFAVAQSTPLPECIAGCEGDTVRRPSFTADLPSAPLCFPCPLRSHRFCKRTPFLVQGGESYAEGFGITILIPKNFRHESFEAEEAAKELTIKAKATEAKAEAKDEAKEAEQTAKKSALVCHMMVRKCLLLMILSPGSSFVLTPKNVTGRVAGDLTLLSRHAYRWDMPEARSTTMHP